MRTDDKNRSIFESKPKYRYHKTYLSNIERDSKIKENQQFIVPWQMEKMVEKRYNFD